MDDQSKVGSRLQDHFADISRIGTVYVASLGEAVDMLESGRFAISAVITDWHFDEGVDEEREIFDGLDLIDYVREHFPHLRVYLMTAHGDSGDLKRKLSQFEEIGVFNKQDFKFRDARSPEGRHTDQALGDEQPWNVVRMDLSPRGVSSSPELIAEREGVSIEEARRRYVMTPMPSTFQTSLHQLATPLVVRRPILVTVSALPDGEFVATADELGLLVDGYGPSPHAAIDDLSLMIAEHYLMLDGMADVEGYSARVLEILRDHIQTAS